jgi:hypothetical protein
VPKPSAAIAGLVVMVKKDQKKVSKKYPVEGEYKNSENGMERFEGGEQGPEAV